MFLFSDIEGSTKRWEDYPDAMQDALHRHDRLMRAAISAHSGHVFKTIGDAFCSAFHTVPSAVGAALEAQRGIATDAWADVGGLSVRMAIHVGHADERDGDYFGPTVNRVARLMSIAHGGQVLISGAAAGLLKGVPPAKATLRDLGQHRLKDLANPEHVYQIIAPDLRHDFPALRSVNALPNNLPLQVTSFVGRETDVAEIKRLLAGARLVSVVGAGGIGKTRTALQVAADLLDEPADGSWFVDLSPVSDASVVAATLASVLAVPESGNDSALETVIGFLKPRHVHLVFDNCEHLIVEAGRTIDAILRGCPHVKVLATTRETLGIAGEHVYRMPPLAVPRSVTSLTAEDAQSFGAIALFADRATAADSRFELTDDNAPVVAEICRRLDGIALAIELAAPRLKLFSVRQLADRLDERFRLLTGGSRTALPRQQTMRALIDWSYDLLSDQERTVLRRFGIFSGGCDLDAVAAICAIDVVSEWLVLDLVSALVEKSLVQVDFQADSQRYRLLESTREYAREALSAAGEFDATAGAHCRYFLDVARRVDELFVREGKSNDAFDLAADAVDNFRAALVWSLTNGNDVPAGCEIAGRLSILWTRELRYEGAHWLRDARARNPQDPAVAARVMLAMSHVLPDGVEKVAAARDAVDAFRQIDDPLSLASALSSEAEALRAVGEYGDASDAQAEGVRLYRAHGNAALVTSAMLTLSSIQTIAGNRQAARQMLEEARTLNPKNGSIATNLAELEFADGDYASAIRHARTALDYFRDRHRYNACIVTCNLAAYCLALGNADEARTTARAALDMARDMRVPDLAALAIQHLASVAALSGKRESAARLLGFVDARYALLGLKRDNSESFTYDRLRTDLVESFDAGALSTLLNEGAAMSEEQAVAQAMTA